MEPKPRDYLKITVGKREGTMITLRGSYVNKATNLQKSLPLDASLSM